MDLIDVIICAYNGHKYIETALNSIIKQTIIDKIRVTIVNDGSTEDYSKIISSYDININIINLNKNHGLGYARNTGIKKTNNPFFTFLDCDDVFCDEHALELLLNGIKNTDYSAVQGKVKKGNNVDYNFTYMHGKLFKRDAIKKNKIKFLNLYTYEDLAFNLTIEFMGLKVNKIDHLVYEYKNINNESVTNTNRKPVKFYDSLLRAYKYAYKKATDYKNVKKYTKILMEELILAYTSSKLQIDDDIIIKNMLRKFYYKYEKYIGYSEVIEKNINLFR